MKEGDRLEFIDTFTGIEDVSGEGDLAVDAIIRAFHGFRGIGDDPDAVTKPEYIIMPRTDIQLKFFVRVVRGKDTTKEVRATLTTIEDVEGNLFLVDMEELDTQDSETSQYRMDNKAAIDMEYLEKVGLNYTLWSN